MEILLYVCHKKRSETDQIEKIIEIKNKMILASLLSLFLNKKKIPKNKTTIAVGMWE